MGNSGNLLKSFYRAEPQVPAKVSRPSPALFIGIIAEGPAIVVSTTGPSHYAVKRVITSTALRAECEDQSRRLDKASYSRPDTRSIATSNHSANRAWESRYGSNRWLSVRVAGRSRELQTECRRKAEADREGKSPSAKI